MNRSKRDVLHTWLEPVLLLTPDFSKTRGAHDMAPLRWLGLVAFLLALVACGGGAGSALQSTDASKLAQLGAAVSAPGAVPLASVGTLSPNEGVRSSTSRASLVRQAALTSTAFFDWAERAHPVFFPGPQPDRVLAPYAYRFYPGTEIYLAVADGLVFALGPVTQNQVISLGKLSDFTCTVDPEGCAPQDTVECAQGALLDKAGNAIFPPEATDIEAPVGVDEDLGSLAALYPDLDTSTDSFYPNLPCEPSIGGTLPPEVPPTQDELNSEEYLSRFESEKGPVLVEQLLANPLPPVSLFSAFTMGDCQVVTEGLAGSPASRKTLPCSDPFFLNANMPFEGRDIIYMHGLDTKDLLDRIKDPTGPASSLWPQNPTEFLSAGGYFRTAAENYWRAHLIEHLSSPVGSGGTSPWPFSGWQWGAADTAPVYASKANRYLVVAWSSNQTMEYAQHALLTQIQLAMTSHKNVVTPSNYPSAQVRPFCANGCVIIGHSTGPLITSSALGLAKVGHFGPGGQEIARHLVAHVSLAGAISGSRIATLGMAVALSGAPPAAVSNLLCPVVDALFGLNNACNADLSFVATSILRDLIPAVSQGVWGASVNLSPVPTVTFAGGHPRGNQAAGLTQVLLPGADDGVVTMNSACGNPNPVFPYVVPPSGMTVSSLVKAFEFSDWAPRLTRGVKMMVSQRNLMVGLPYPGPNLGPLYLASACTPYLASSGMVMPVDNAFSRTPFDARARYDNHYSFIQSLAEHSYDGGGSPAPSMWPSYVAGLASALREYAPQNSTFVAAVSGTNLEESRVVTDPTVYTRLLDTNGTHLLKPLDMRVVQRGKRVSFNMPFNIGMCVKKGVAKWYCTRWIWKRTYHLADKWEQKQSSHYAYEYVARR
jgi:hypothetical protein